MPYGKMKTKELDISSHLSGMRRRSQESYYNLESLTANILQDPICINNRDIRAELTDILTAWEKRTTLTGSFINYVLKKLRGYFVPVPIWIVSKHIDIHAKGLPIVKFDKLAYTSKYGLMEKWLQT